MNIAIKVVREEPDRLSKREWDFALIDNKLVLDHYAQLSRASTSHKFKEEKGYGRFLSMALPEDEVPWTPDIADEARSLYLQAVAEKVRVGRWKADFGR